MKKGKHLILSVAILWALLTALNFVWPDRDFSENENRFLQEAPAVSTAALLDGRFQEQTESYVNDQFPWRDVFVEAKAVCSRLLGRISLNGVLVCDDALIGEFKQPDEKITRENAAGIRDFMENYSVPADVILVPTAAYIQSDRLPAFSPVYDQNAYIESVYETLPEQNCINICGALAAHKDEYIYYRTDHHWTTYGAYLAYEKYCESAGISPLPYSGQTVSENFNGTLFSSSGIRSVTPDVIEAVFPKSDTSLMVDTGGSVSEREEIYFEEFLQKKDKYSFFLGTNEFLVTIKSGCGSGKRLLVFKDSYAHCFAPMLADQFSEIALVDLRYTSRPVSETIDIESYDRVLFMLSSTVFGTQSNTSKLF